MSAHGRQAPKVPRLPQLATNAPGRYRLNWVGSLSPGPATAPFSFRVAAQFVELSPRKPRVVTIDDLAVGLLPYLSATTVWQDGELAGFHTQADGQFEIDMGNFDPARNRAVSPYEVLPSRVYPLHRMPGACWCRIYPTTEGPELIVPSWEIIRNWYLFDSRIIPSVLAGAIARPELLQAKRLPWQPEHTRLLPPDGAEIVHADRLSREAALCLARLLLDPPARAGANFLHQNIKAFSQRPIVALPPVLPPFRGRSRWHVDFVPIGAHEGHPARLLVTCLRGSDEPLPYQWISVTSVTDFRQAPHDGELMPVHRNTTQIVMPDDDALDLYGDGYDASLEGATTLGLFFGNSALNVEVRQSEKTAQRYRGMHDDKPAVPAVGASVDDTALHRDGMAPSATSNVVRADDRQRTRTHVLEIAPLFAEVLAEVTKELGADWRGDFPYGAGAVRVHDAQRGTKRGFVVARLTNELRHLYLLDAETLTESESFRLVVAERRHGGTLGAQQLQQWLGGFPYRPGCPWECETSQRLGLVLQRHKHQPHLLNQTPEYTRLQFKRRLTDKIVSLVRG